MTCNYKDGKESDRMFNVLQCIAFPKAHPHITVVNLRSAVNIVKRMVTAVTTYTHTNIPDTRMHHACSSAPRRPNLAASAADVSSGLLPEFKCCC